MKLICDNYILSLLIIQREKKQPQDNLQPSRAIITAVCASKLEALGLEVVARPGKEGQERMLKERAAWKPVVEASGYVAED